MDDLLDTLTALRAEPSRAIDLYRQLYQASFFALVQSDSENRLESHLFLTYPTSDEILELPIFTLREFILEGLPEEALLIEVSGPSLWPRMLDIVETGKCEVAVDPGQPHGIRLTREMILGMTVDYGRSAY